MTDFEYTYEEWMKRVDLEVERLAGLSVHDLPDFPSRMWFDDGVTPREAAIDVLEDEGLDFDFEESVA